MIEATEKIYKAFGTILNDKNNIPLYYQGERELIFYRCNQSGNRGDANKEDLTGIHGVICINSFQNSFFRKQTYKNDDDCERFCDLTKEKICNISNAFISINLYSNEDNALNILSNLISFLKLENIKNKFSDLGIIITNISTIRRLDEIIFDKFEYRAQVDLEIQALISVVEQEKKELKEVNFDIEVCSKKIEATILRE